MNWRSCGPLPAPSPTKGPPPNLLQRIADLQQRFVAAKDLCVPFEFFDDHVAASPDLFPNSDSGTNERLLAAIRACAEQVRPTFDLLHHAMFEVRGTGFWHGIGHSQHDHVYFFHFDPIGMGLVGLCNPTDPRGLIHYLRFSVINPVGVTMPSRVVRGSA